MFDKELVYTALQVKKEVLTMIKVSKNVLDHSTNPEAREAARQIIEQGEAFLARAKRLEDLLER